MMARACWQIRRQLSAFHDGELPVGDRSVEFVFTMGVLIHQPEETLEKVMSEMVRASSRSRSVVAPAACQRSYTVWSISDE